MRKKRKRGASTLSSSRYQSGIDSLRESLDFEVPEEEEIALPEEDIEKLRELLTPSKVKEAKIERSEAPEMSPEEHAYRLIQAVNKLRIPKSEKKKILSKMVKEISG